MEWRGLPTKPGLPPGLQVGPPGLVLRPLWGKRKCWAQPVLCPRQRLDVWPAGGASQATEATSCGEHCPPTTAVGSRRRRRPQRGGHSTRQQCPGTAAWPATGQGARQGPVRSAVTRSTAPASSRGAPRAGPDLRGPCKLESTSATLLPRFCDSNVITCLPWTRKHKCRLEKISDNYASRHRLCSP